jgi:PBP1b-binding outer membrane lipoprotein LpoB
MKKTLISLLAGAIALSGCHSSHKPKPNPAVATEVEQEFMQRWVDQRVHDYLAQGKFNTDAAARAQATNDFYQQYPYTTLAQKAGAGAPEPK